jgi:1-acyl-sn-glycerol-3-phosphate acyltransferase
MKNWSFGYEIIRTYVRFGFWLTHKEIVVTGRHLIPKGKPVIFAPNHQNALMDPLALACTNSRQSVWLARADIFQSKKVSSILKYLKLLPVYRIRDGKDNLSNNEDIFAQVIQLLENNQSVALFPEAAHSGKRQMLPHKKAIPRIAIEAEAKNNFHLDLQIVPVGIYYSHYWKFNRSLIVEYGEPISVDKYKFEYTENPQKAMISLRDKIYNRLSPLTFQINSKTHYNEYEQICQLTSEAYSQTHVFCNQANLQLFAAKKELVGKIEQIEKSHPERFEKLIEGTTNYFEALKIENLSDKQIVLAEKAKWSLLFVKVLGALCALPLFAFGFIFNAIPFIVPRTILRRKVKDITFLSSFNFVVGLVAFPLFYLVATTLIFAWTDSLKIAFITLITMPLASKIAYQLFVFYCGIFHEFIFLYGHKSRRNIIKQLIVERNTQIRSILEEVNT